MEFAGKLQTVSSSIARLPRSTLFAVIQAHAGTYIVNSVTETLALVTDNSQSIQFLGFDDVEYLQFGTLQIILNLRKTPSLLTLQGDQQKHRAVYKFVSPPYFDEKVNSC